MKLPCKSFAKRKFGIPKNVKVNKQYKEKNITALTIQKHNIDSRMT